LDAEYLLEHGPSRVKPWDLYIEGFPGYPRAYIKSFDNREEAVEEMKRRHEVDLESKRRQAAIRRYLYDKEGNLIES